MISLHPPTPPDWFEKPGNIGWSGMCSHHLQQIAGLLPKFPPRTCQHPSFVAPNEHSWNSKDELPLGGGDSLSSSSPVPPFCCQHGVDCVSAKKTIIQPQNAAWTTEPLAFGANLRTGSQEGSHTMAYHEEPWAHSSETLQDHYFQNSCFGKWPFIDSGTGTTIGWFQQKWTKHSTISNKFSLKNPGLL